jgi:hypothetical protein
LAMYLATVDCATVNPSLSNSARECAAHPKAYSRGSCAGSRLATRPEIGGRPPRYSRTSTASSAGSRPDASAPASAAG